MQDGWLITVSFPCRTLVVGSVDCTFFIACYKCLILLGSGNTGGQVGVRLPCGVLLGETAAKRECHRQATCLAYDRVSCTVCISNGCHIPRLLNRTLHYNKKINIMNSICQWTESCDWLVCAALWVWKIMCNHVQESWINFQCIPFLLW